LGRLYILINDFCFESTQNNSMGKKEKEKKKSLGLQGYMSKIKEKERKSNS